MSKRRLSVSERIVRIVEEVAERERRTLREVIELLFQIGYVQYRRRNSLSCGFHNCTRKECCGGIRRGTVVQFPVDRKIEEDDGTSGETPP